LFRYQEREAVKIDMKAWSSLWFSVWTIFLTCRESSLQWNWSASGNGNQWYQDLAYQNKVLRSGFDCWSWGTQIISIFTLGRPFDYRSDLIIIRWLLW
jgi:hypothetical protein